MNKSELVEAIAAETKLPKASVEKVLDAQTMATYQALNLGDEVTLHGLGKLKPAHRKGRTGRNPQTGATLEIPAKIAPVFSASKALKDALNQV